TRSRKTEGRVIPTPAPSLPLRLHRLLPLREKVPEGRMRGGREFRTARRFAPIAQPEAAKPLIRLPPPSPARGEGDVATRCDKPWSFDKPGVRAWASVTLRSLP